MKASVFALLVAAGLVSAAPVADPQITNPGNSDGGPDPSKVYISGISYGGSGCPQGTVSQILSPDAQTFTLIFDQYQAQIGPGIDPILTRSNCQLNVQLHYPSGWQYSVFKADYRGYASLDKGVTGTQKSTYYFSGDSHQCSTASNFYGPQAQDYLVEDKIDTTSLVWSPCGSVGYMNINSQVRLTSNVASAQGLMTDDSIDGQWQHIVGIQWQQCRPHHS